MSATNGSNYTTNGLPRIIVTSAELEERLRLALEEAHDFPGYYPIVVIARTGPDFEQLLMAWLAAEQGQAPFEITSRASRKGTYISYRLRLHVEDAETAMRRKANLSGLEGVILIL